jgi:hypothetical protein
VGTPRICAYSGQCGVGRRKNEKSESSEGGISDDDDSHEAWSLNSEKSTPPCDVWVVPYRLTRKRWNYGVDTVRRSGNEVQLVVSIPVELPNGQKRFLRMLVDTGAQVNIIRKGLIGPENFENAKKPLTLITANGQVMDGGRRVVSMKLKFRQTSDIEEVEPELTLTGTFFEADVGIDGILSYPLQEKYAGSGTP